MLHSKPHFNPLSPVPDTFLYFAYGSNLLKKRIRLNNPTAEFVGIGRLHDHQLDFLKESKRWNGPSATIVPTPGCYVWGVIWRLHDRDLPALDRQEGVGTNWYFPKTAHVVLPDETVVECRTYQQSVNPPMRRENECLPYCQRPSVTYLEVIIQGAIECRLPQDYIEKLKQIPHNGKYASPEMIEQLKMIEELQFKPTEREIFRSGTFLYFAYNANMLKFRMHMHTPSAEFISIGRLDDYRLEFIKYSHFWGGPSGTLVPTANAHTWGVVWRIDKGELVNLDQEKKIDYNIYYIKYLEINTPHMGSFVCRAYIKKVNPLPRGDNDEIPVERWPSWGFKQVILMGAIENKLPESYIKMLKKLRDNGDEGCVRVTWLLMKYGRNKPCPCVVPGKTPRQPLKIHKAKIAEGLLRNPHSLLKHRQAVTDHKLAVPKKASKFK